MEDKPTILSTLGIHLKLAFTLRGMSIHFDVTKCKGLLQCYEVCPMGCWEPEEAERIVQFHHAERCIACGACVLQCPEGAIELN